MIYFGEKNSVEAVERAVETFRICLETDFLQLFSFSN